MVKFVNRERILFVKILDDEKQVIKREIKTEFTIRNCY